MKFLQVKIICISIIFLIFFYSCSKDVNKMIVSIKNPKHKIIIGSVKSKFKEKVIEEIVNKYKKTSEIEVTGLSKMKNISYKKYDVIVIMDECWAWMKFNKKVKTIFNKIEVKKKIVLFITAGKPDWKWKYKGIDAITSASIKGKEKDAANRIIKRIDEVLEK